ncbi:MAG: hypothetical protein ABF553_07495 [Acetobacter orientalis]|uniref:hypothetical protein n=1 Tax=Acetobacter orientalis TaxID=146474 RepID=UPI0039E72CC4
MTDINKNLSDWHKEGACTSALLQRHPTQIEIVQSDCALAALCNDGSIWGISLKNVGAEWHQLPAIPQPERPTGPAEGQNYPEPDQATCPVQCVGTWQHETTGGEPYAYHFIDAAGNERNIAPRHLTNRHELIGLFGGTDTWLRANFPKKGTIRRSIGSIFYREEAVVDFWIDAAARWLMAECLKATSVSKQKDGEP